MTPLEIIATVFAVIILVKLVLIMINPSGWMKMVKPLYVQQKNTIMFVYAVLAIVLGYYIFQSMSIVQVSAVMFFTAALMGLAVAPHGKDILALADSIVKRRIQGLCWISFAVWVLIALWTLKAIFG
ncbi:MAG: hypothetical protein QF486_03490 [Candidatus Woesearchaeota archaeon]|nr:hypothetical protein [Candidatus Woesearchaeota archaeon]MDP7182058.1 hypothetical protein [Candidatus Woesearchaeota archaeon]MDP7198660.1 hypothetical protein [Candidatus Woesearchaeota archaeon]MDP7467634.1 hypothetical protein [Candidatus Woesearchaeota archaeon]MDP7647148.1 hypothetical protein [Candidatus Woesearchaeota archaeon]